MKFFFSRAVFGRKAENSKSQPTFFAHNINNSTTDRDEYEEYIRMAPVPCEKPLEWWGARREEYPRLSRLAFNLLSIPLMSAECERVFSAAKRFVTDERNKLRKDILEAMIVLRAQYKAEESEAKEARR